MPDNYPPDWDSGCDSQCSRCDNRDCEEHPEERWQWDLEAYEARFCPYGGIGSYNAGDEQCMFMCRIRKLCEELEEEERAKETADAC